VVIRGADLVTNGGDFTNKMWEFNQERLGGLMMVDVRIWKRLAMFDYGRVFAIDLLVVC